MNFAVISSDANYDYAFHALLTCLAWRALDYRPLLLLVGGVRDWFVDPRLRLVVERCRRYGAVVQFTGAFPGRRTSTVAQVARLYAACTPFVADNDRLLTSDVDMWPLGSWVGSAGGGPKMHLYYSNAYEGEPQPKYPMCYIDAPAATWREVMGAERGMFREAIEDALVECERAVAAEEVPESSRGREWNFDEWWFGKKLAAWSGFPKQCVEIPRDLRRRGERRIDRSGWVVPASLDGFADAHLLRPGFTDDNWQAIRSVLAMALPARWMEWADDYRAAWVNT